MNNIRIYKTLALTSMVATSLLLNAQADITTGLAGYWTFNDGSGSSTAADSSTYSDTGTLTGFSDTTYSSMWVTGFRGGISESNAILFNNGATGNYVSIPYQSQLSFNTGLQFTISAWIKSSVAAGSQTGGAGIIVHGTSGAGQQYTIDMNAGQFRFYVYNASAAHTIVTGTVSPAANTWYHVAGVFNASATGTKQQVFYINGTANASATPPTTLVASTSVVSIGNRLNSGVYTLPFQGTIDEVRIYNRALSATDIKELYGYGSTTPPTITGPNPVSCYAGDTAEFSATATGFGGLAISGYQWQSNGVIIAGATNSTLALTNVQLANTSVSVMAWTGAASTGITNTNTVALTVNPLPPPNTTSGLVGWWKFNDGSGSSTAADSTTNANTGTLTGFADTTFTTMWTNGLFNGALAFNADTTDLDVVAVPSEGVAGPAALDFSANGATGSPVFTLTAWVKAPATQVSGAAIIARGTGGGGEQYVMDLNSGHYRFYVHDTNGVVWQDQTTVAPNGTWQHLAAVLNATNGIMNYYVNGVLAAGAVAPTSLSTSASTQPMNIGNRQAGAGAYGDAFTGLIEDVHVFNRSLTSADVEALYLLEASPPTIVTQPQSASLYVGDNLKLSATAGGTVPLSYQWQQNGTNLPGATNTSLIFTPTVASNAGTYVLVITNFLGVTNSFPAIVTLTPFALTNALAAWWTFDEGPGSCTAPDSSTNGNNGSLIDFPDCTSEWVSGRVNDAITFNTTSPVNEYVDVPYGPSLDFNVNLNFSLTAWVKGPATQVSGGCVVCKGFGSLNEQYCVDVSSGFYRFYVRSSTGGATILLTPIAPNGDWQHLVATYDGNFGVMTFYVNGQPVATNAAAPSTLLGENYHDVTIGCRESSSSSGFNLPFAGLIDDVRIYNRTLSANDAQTLYQAAGLLGPVFYTQPQGASVFVGGNYTLSAVADGTAPLSFQWQFDGANVAGATNSSLVLTNLQTTNSGTYNLLISNAVAGPLSSSNAVLQVSVFNISNTVGWWKFDDGVGSSTAADSSGYGDAGALNGFPDYSSDWWVAGRINGALNFETDPSTESTYQTYVAIPDAPQLNFTSSLAFSLAAWVRGSVEQVANAGIICKGYSPDEQYAMDVYGGNFRMYVRNAAAASTTLPCPVGPDGRWQHLVGTFDINAGVMNLYVNGSLVASGSPPASLLANTHVVSVGSREANSSSGYNYTYNGAIDDVRVYSRALTASQVMALYQAAPALPLVFYTQPKGATNYTGSSVTLSPVADGTDPLAYQWLKNTRSIAGATNLTLTLNNLQASDSGTYTLQVTNATGSILSSNAVVLVLPITFSGGSFLSDGTFQINFSGPPNASFTLYSTTNVSLPLAQWTVLESSSLDGNGQGVFVDSTATGNQTQFYSLQVQLP
jgi:hypothetical protein